MWKRILELKEEVLWWQLLETRIYKFSSCLFFSLPLRPQRAHGSHPSVAVRIGLVMSWVWLPIRFWPLCSPDSYFESSSAILLSWSQPSRRKSLLPPGKKSGSLPCPWVQRIHKSLWTPQTKCIFLSLGYFLWSHYKHPTPPFSWPIPGCNFDLTSFREALTLKIWKTSHPSVVHLFFYECTHVLQC